MTSADIFERISRIEDLLDFLESRTFINYDKGSYSPTYLGQTTPGVTTYAANGQVGYWTRFGRIILFNGRVEWTAATGTGNANISLPFTPVNVTNLNSAISLDTNLVTFAGGSPQGLVQSGVSFFLMRSPLTNAGSVVVQVEAAGIVNFGGFYEVVS